MFAESIYVKDEAGDAIYGGSYHEVKSAFKRRVFSYKRG